MIDNEWKEENLPPISGRYYFLDSSPGLRCTYEKINKVWGRPGNKINTSVLRMYVQGFNSAMKER